MSKYKDSALTHCYLCYIMKEEICCHYFMHCSFLSGQVRSGQVRSECLMCTFRESCCSAPLSKTGKEGGDGGGGGGGHIHWRVQESTSSPPVSSSQCNGIWNVLWD